MLAQSLIQGKWQREDEAYPPLLSIKAIRKTELLSLTEQLTDAYVLQDGGMSSLRIPLKTLLGFDHDDYLHYRL